MSTPSADVDIQVTTKTKPEEQTRARQVPPHNVILENDDYHTFEFVVGVIRKVLGYAEERAVQLTFMAHHSGRSVVWTGPKEVAELKVEQIRTYHETRSGDGAKLGPLSCVIEPAPGG